MGRNVNYLNNAEYVIYFMNECLFNSTDVYEWEDFSSNLKHAIKKKLKSYYDCDKWDNRETAIILENNLCEIGISEYCGLYSLSIRAKKNSYCSNNNIEALGKHHAEQIRITLEICLSECGVELVNRIGTFSNGTGIFESKKGIHDNAVQII